MMIQKICVTDYTKSNLVFRYQKQTASLNGNWGVEEFVNGFRTNSWWWYNRFISQGYLAHEVGYHSSLGERSIDGTLDLLKNVWPKVGSNEP